MRFKKLIAAGGAFLLVLGASTLGAAAAYADDGTTSGDTVVTDTTTATAPADETPPAPDPVVETPPASDPVVETPPASDPVVETTDPVDSNTPSSESDSDPPADTSSGSSDSGSSSGSTSTKSITSFTRTTATLKTFFVADAPVDNTNEVTYWENLYPGTTCYKDDTTYGSVTGDGLGVILLPGTYAVLIVKSGAEDNGDGPGNAVFEDPTPGNTYYGPLNNGGQQGAVSHWIVCITDGQVGSEVTPAAVGDPQTCDAEEEELVGGTITVTPITDVTYSLVGPLGDLGGPYGAPDGNNQWTGLAPGDYEVTYTLGSGQTSNVTNPISVTVGAFDGDCVGDPCDTASTAPVSLNTVDNCCDTNNVASLNTDTAPTCPLPDVWLCHATQANPNANNPYNGQTLPWQGAVGHAFPNPNDDHSGDIIPPFDYYDGNGDKQHYPGSALWLSLYSAIDPDSQAWHDFVDADCVETEEVTPAATPSPQTCPEGLPVGGSITVTPITGVKYNLTGPGGPYPELTTGSWTGLTPGNYLVTYTLGSGQTSNVTNPIPVTVAPTTDPACQLIEHDIVAPSADPVSEMTCLGDGSYRVDNDQGDPAAVIWTANGSPLNVTSAPQTFTVSSPGVITLHAEAGPGFGFQQAYPDWVFTFERPDGCDLDTLALTGQSPIAFLGGAMALILGGLAMFRIRSMRRERPGSFI